MEKDDLWLTNSMSKMENPFVFMECMKTFSLSQPDLNQFVEMTRLYHIQYLGLWDTLSPSRCLIFKADY